MVKVATNVNMQRKDREFVHTFFEIGDIWRNWNGKNLSNIPAKIYYVLYRWFNKNLEWIKQLEQRYMIVNDVKYKGDEEKNHDN